MTRSLSSGFVGALCVVALVGGSAPVEAQQSLGLNVGYFSVRGEDARIAEDVLLENRNLFAFDFARLPPTSRTLAGVRSARNG